MVSHAQRDPLPQPGGGWLYGPSTDLLIGAGLGYVVSLPILAWIGAHWGVTDFPLTLIALISLLISGPHYGATILRVYEHRNDRRRYAVFALWSTLALCVLFVAGLHDAWLGSILVTLYATWSPWHFSGQNYGLALMLVRRRGVAIDPIVKRLFYSSFVLSFALWVLIMHGERYDVVAPGLPESTAPLFQFVSLRIPARIVAIAVPLVAIAYAASLLGAGWLLLRRARLRDLAPAICLVALQAIWYAVPALARELARNPLNGLAFTAIWISAAHGVQYLWVTSYYAKREDPAHRLGPYLGRALLAGSTVTILPGFLFAPWLLGLVAWDAGLAILLVSVVNLHHFVLDGAIWKLRDGKVAQLLLRAVGAQSDSAATPVAQRSWFRPAMAVLGVASLAIASIDLWQREYVINRSGVGEIEPRLRASQWLAWIGRENPDVHTGIAQALADRNEPDAAIAEYRRSLALHPTPDAWLGLGEVQLASHRWSEASESFAAVLVKEPDHLPALVSAGVAWMNLGQPDRARESFARARSLAPRNAAIQKVLQQAESAGY